MKNGPEFHVQFDGGMPIFNAGDLPENKPLR